MRIVINNLSKPQLDQKDFVVQCAHCGQQFTNHLGSTPCCGSIAYLLDDEGKVTDQIVLAGRIENNSQEYRDTD